MTVKMTTVDTLLVLLAREESALGVAHSRADELGRQIDVHRSRIATLRAALEALSDEPQENGAARV